ncbi:hypothetical protein, partial [Myroides pelagicus]
YDASVQFWTSVCVATLSDTLSLIYGFCWSGQGFAVSFLQIPPHDGHPCCWLTLPTVKACSGLTPYSYCPCWAHNRKGIPGTGIPFSEL